MSFPPSPSSQGTPSGTESPVGQSQQLSSSASEAPSRSSNGNNIINGLVNGESIMTPTGTIPGAQATGSAGGAVRRKPARRANTAERRATHNMVERQRRETLNGRFLDLAGLLPNLANVRRPSKSAIVNSSIALVHTQRRFRAIAARELKQLAQEADALRREVNEWRAAHPMSPVPSARASSASTPLEAVVEPPRSSEFTTMVEMEDTSAAEDSMTDQERIAYEMRGGDSGPLGASLDENDEEFPGAFGGSMDEDATPIRQPQQPFQLQIPQQQQQQQPFKVQPQQPQMGPAQGAVDAGANRARAQSLSVPRHLSHQQAQFDQQQQYQLNSQQMAAAASLIPSTYSAHPQQQNQQQQQQQYALQQQQQFQQQAMQMASLGLGVAGSNGAGPFSQPFFPPSFDAIAAAAAGVPSSLPNMNGMGAFGQHQHHQQVLSTPVNEQDAAKLAAWNAHLFSAALAAQQQQRDQQAQQQFGFQPRTPPTSSHGRSSPFDVGIHRAKSEEHDNIASAASTPGSSHSSSVPPSLTLSTSGLSATSSPPSSASGLSHYESSGMPSSLPSSLASPLHNLSLASQQHDTFGIAGPFGYGSAPTSGWAGVKTPVGTPPVPVGGGGGGMGGYMQYPMMSIFI